jgi:predicted proteasome-type protease
VTLQERIDEDDPYWRDLGMHWNEGLKRAFATVPYPQWLGPA